MEVGREGEKGREKEGGRDGRRDGGREKGVTTIERGAHGQ